VSEPACDVGSDRHCITCGDDGIPMRVVGLRASDAICVDQDGERHEVAVDLIGELELEQTILVHAGVAIAAL
jgi:hydrogenase maturation factor